MGGDSGQAWSAAQLRKLGEQLLNGLSSYSDTTQKAPCVQGDAVTLKRQGGVLADSLAYFIQQCAGCTWTRCTG